MCFWEAGRGGGGRAEQFQQQQVTAQSSSASTADQLCAAQGDVSLQLSSLAVAAEAEAGHQALVKWNEGGGGGGDAYATAALGSLTALVSRRWRGGGAAPLSLSCIPYDVTSSIRLLLLPATPCCCC